MRKDNSRTSRLLFAGILVFLFVYYAQIHPVYVFSGDDWTYIGGGRSAVPSMRSWNPARIFPETIMPVVASFAAFVIKPLTGDYMLSLTITFAAFIASFITCYFYSVYRFLRRLYFLDRLQAGGVLLLFFLFHYFCFASLDENNLHLLYVYDLTNCFYYMLPTLLNIMLALLWTENEESKGLFSERAPFFVGILVLLFYLAVFSNLFCSYLLAIHVLFYLAEDVWKNRTNFHIMAWIKKNGAYLVTGTCFLIALVLDANGARAESMQTGFALSETMAILMERLYYVKKVFLLFAILLFSAALFIRHCGRMRGEKDPSDTTLIRLLMKCVCGGMLSLIYVVLLCAASNPMYIKRMDVLLGPFFFLLLGMAGAAAYIVKRVPGVGMIFPLALFIGTSLIWSAEGRSFLGARNPQGWIALENYHIRQLQEADRSGQTSVTLELTDVYEESWMAERIVRALYKHGMISEELEVKPLRNHELAKRFHLHAPVLPWS